MDTKKKKASIKLTSKNYEAPFQVPLSDELINSKILSLVELLCTPNLVESYSITTQPGSEEIKKIASSGDRKHKLSFLLKYYENEAIIGSPSSSTLIEILRGLREADACDIRITFIKLCLNLPVITELAKKNGFAAVFLEKQGSVAVRNWRSEPAPGDKKKDANGEVIIKLDSIFDLFSSEVIGSDLVYDYCIWAKVVPPCVDVKTKKDYIQSLLYEIPGNLSFIVCSKPILADSFEQKKYIVDKQNPNTRVMISTISALKAIPAPPIKGPGSTHQGDRIHWAIFEIYKNCGYLLRVAKPPITQSVITPTKETKKPEDKKEKKELVIPKNPVSTPLPKKQAMNTDDDFMKKCINQQKKPSSLPSSQNGTHRQKKETNEIIIDEIDPSLLYALMAQGEEEEDDGEEGESTKSGAEDTDEEAEILNGADDLDEEGNVIGFVGIHPDDEKKLSSRHRRKSRIPQRRLSGKIMGEEEDSESDDEPFEIDDTESDSDEDDDEEGVDDIEVSDDEEEERGSVKKSKIRRRIVDDDDDGVIEIDAVTKRELGESKKHVNKKVLIELKRKTRDLFNKILQASKIKDLQFISLYRTFNIKVARIVGNKLFPYLLKQRLPEAELLNDLQDVFVKQKELNSDTRNIMRELSSNISDRKDSKAVARLKKRFVRK